MNETLTNLTTIVIDRYSFLEKCIYSIFMFPIIFFSIIGNILVIVAISKYSYLKITNNIFLASLAVSDLFVAIFAMTFNAFQVLYGGWPFKAFMCRFFFFSDILFSTASILHLLCVSFDRYLSISDEFTFYYTAEHPTKSWRVRIMLLSVWLFSATISLFCFTNYFTTNESVAMIQKLDTNNGYCDFIVNRSFRYFSACFSFWVPAIGLIIFYSLVMKKANKMERNKLRIYNSLHFIQTVNVNNHNRNSSARSSGEVIWKRKYKVKFSLIGFRISAFKKKSNSLGSQNIGNSDSSIFNLLVALYLSLYILYRRKLDVS